MTTEEFQQHLIEMQEALAASGVDISTMIDPTELSTEELDELKAEMSHSKQGPPPPPSDTDALYEMITLFDTLSLNMVDYTSEEMYSSLFDFL